MVSSEMTAMSAVSPVALFEPSSSSPRRERGYSRRFDSATPIVPNPKVSFAIMESVGIGKRTLQRRWAVDTRGAVENEEYNVLSSEPFQIESDVAGHKVVSFRLFLEGLHTGIGRYRLYDTWSGKHETEVYARVAVLPEKPGETLVTLIQSGKETNKIDLDYHAAVSVKQSRDAYERGRRQFLSQRTNVAELVENAKTYRTQLTTICDITPRITEDVAAD